MCNCVKGVCRCVRGEKEGIRKRIQVRGYAKKMGQIEEMDMGMGQVYRRGRGERRGWGGQDGVGK